MEKIRTKIKAFSLIRAHDHSGVSGTGKVLHGVMFPDGTTVVQWVSENLPSSVVIHDSFENFKLIHIDKHPGNGSKLVWDKQ